MKLLIVASMAGLIVSSTLAAEAATTSCSTVAACIFGSNTSSGIGVEGSSKSDFGVSGVSSSGHGVNGISSSSFGVVGITTENATSAGTARAGVLGEDSSTNNKSFDSGVAGSSKYGYGISGTTTYGTGVSGTATNIGVAVSGTAPNGIGGWFTGQDFGIIVDGGGAQFSTSAADDPAANNGYFATIISYGAEGGTSQGPVGDVFLGEGCYATGSSEEACDQTSDIDSHGNASFNTITLASGQTIKTKRANGAMVASYAARSASPTIEDFGTGTMRNGVAFVALDNTFASTISPGYLVFVTPHGDSNSLYTQPSKEGFTVRESKGGRSSLTFDYRVVAKPLDAKASHLPVISTAHDLAKHVAVPRAMLKHRRQ